MAEKGLHKYFKDFWTKDAGLTYILLFVCIGDFIVTPFLIDNYLLRMLYGIFWIVLLFAGIGIMVKSRRKKIIVAVILAVSIVTKLINVFSGIEIAGYAGNVFQVAAFCLLIWLVLMKVFQEGPITAHRIVGAVVVYMLIGNLWAEMFQIIYQYSPGAINMPLSDGASTPAQASFLYFSFTTLTTTGYGDFLPVNPVARTLVIIEQLIGVLYPVILIGRLVSLRIES